MMWGGTAAARDYIKERLGKAVKSYEKTIRKEQEKLVKAYKDAIAAYTKKGDLDSALKVRAERDAFLKSCENAAAVSGHLCKIAVIPNTGVSVQELVPKVSRLSGFGTPITTIAEELKGAKFTRVRWKATPTYKIKVLSSGYLYVTNPTAGSREKAAKGWEHLKGALKGSYLSGVWRVKVTKGSIFSLTGYESMLVASAIELKSK
jgi:hypothetical protein